jgi:Domain of unknown function (DUF4845)
VKLPLWRLIAALLVLCGMAAVLISLAPVYFEDYRLRQNLRQIVRVQNASDDALRSAVVERARSLDLPVRPADIQINHSGGKTQVEMKYAVEMDFRLYQVDVHFHGSAHN